MEVRVMRVYLDENDIKSLVLGKTIYKTKEYSTPLFFDILIISYLRCNI